MVESREVRVIHNSHLHNNHKMVRTLISAAVPDD